MNKAPAPTGLSAKPGSRTIPAPKPGDVGVVAVIPKPEVPPLNLSPELLKSSIGAASRRDLFAAAALIAIAGDSRRLVVPQKHTADPEAWHRAQRRKDAAWCVAMADEMLNATVLEPETKPEKLNG